MTVQPLDSIQSYHAHIYFSSPEERRVSPLLYRVLHDTAAAISAAPENVAASLQNGLVALRQGGFAPDYLELRDLARQPGARWINATENAVVAQSCRLPLLRQRLIRLSRPRHIDWHPCRAALHARQET